MKFKIDENLPVEFAELLILAGYDALTVPAQRLQGKADSRILEVCLRERRILVTLDLGFADMRTYPHGQYPGLIILRVGHQNKRHLIEVFQNVLPLLKKESVENRLWIVEESRIRIRHLL